MRLSSGKFLHDYKRDRILPILEQMVILSQSLGKGYNQTQTRHSKMIIRNATPNDLSPILSLIQQKIGFDPNIAAFSDILRLSEYRVREILSGSIPVSYILLSEISGRLVGFAFYEFKYSLFVGKPSIWVDELYVDEEMRSQGIGSGLMHHLAQIAKENNCDYLSWYADERNTRSVTFYERLGAEIRDQKGNRCFFVWML